MHEEDIQTRCGPIHHQWYTAEVTKRPVPSWSFPKCGTPPVNAGAIPMSLWSVLIACLLQPCVFPAKAGYLVGFWKSRYIPLKSRMNKIYIFFWIRTYFEKNILFWRARSIFSSRSLSTRELTGWQICFDLKSVKRWKSWGLPPELKLVFLWRWQGI